MVQKPEKRIVITSENCDSELIDYLSKKKMEEYEEKKLYKEFPLLFLILLRLNV